MSLDVHVMILLARSRHWQPNNGMIEGNRYFSNLFSGHYNCWLSIAFIPHLDLKLFFRANSGSISSYCFELIREVSMTYIISQIIAQDITLASNQAVQAKTQQLFDWSYTSVQFLICGLIEDTNDTKWCHVQTKNRTLGRRYVVFEVLSGKLQQKVLTPYQNKNYIKDFTK